MISTFHGLEVARKGMNAQQSALYTTGHNIANASTPGYSRQRVNFETTSPYPSPSMNRPQIPGQMGTGVQAGSIQRMRDSFIDDQFRGENNKLGYWSARSQSLSSMETIMNEPTEQGLANTMDQFWKSLQDLSVTPQDSGTRSVVRQRGLAVADTFNYLSSSLSAVQKDYKSEIDVTQKAVNSIIKQINDLNGQIGDVEVHGYLPNDLYDKRDLLLDNLSKYVNINVDAKSSGGLSSAIAEGKFDIYLADDNGNILKDDNGKHIKLVDSTMNEAYGISINYDSGSAENPVGSINILQLDKNGEGYDGFAVDPKNPAAIANSFAHFETLKNNSSGSLISHIESYGYKTSDGKVKGLYPDMLRKLDEMAFTFAQKFNEVHRSGWSLTELNDGVKDGKNFFAFEGTAPNGSNPYGAAKNLKLHEDVLETTDNIAAAAEGTTVSLAMSADAANDSDTDGNPVVSGSVEFPTDVSAEWDGSEWDYTVTVNNPGGAEVLTGSLSDSVSAMELPNGLKLDFSEITSKAVGDKWTLAIPVNAGTIPADEAFAGSGSNAAALANVKDEILNYGGTTSTVTSFYQSIIGDMGVKASQANQMAKNTGVLAESALTRRESVSSVSLDEEMTNMIKFQHAYNAAARNITMVDEMLDKIINSMGLVGR
ncbi:flagellar hook-associated protein FlgK [Cytobacillus firmus]|uniref:Flagellar hook-associated protein 1 n=1 Tax=Cytobacillus firmus DS1 TaxID=1307436 RepID=W7KVH7_CYTFI|nr:flagellar hook-associated protein FlgK [Cytobacillus firmus]EWG11490.1 flagellar hook-associated protein FlgK [Cytobacillus firmus DS1]